MSESIGKRFMALSQHKQTGPSPQSQGVPQPPLELPWDSTLTVIELPDPKTFKQTPVNLIELITDRRTGRKYTRQALTLAELSLLLWTTQGVKEITGRPATLRTVPSAGSRHAFETYMMINLVEGLEPGLYRYIATRHQLICLEASADVNPRITEACLKQEHIASSAVTFFWVAAAERMTWRYGERGYRYIHLDAGHVCQNLYLTAATIGCGVCAIGAFSDDDLNQALGVDGDQVFAVYGASLGKR